MEEELDSFDFVLAEALHMTVARMNDEMPNNEYIAWRAFYVYREAQLELARKEMR
ncbi:MAG: hypothetical protein QOF11_2703 [Chloroflexota bacterium]|jgi:hypothetical protein|nr:hypothetical protein [Chloroflexota bacterium]